MSESLQVSPFFFGLYDLYHAELESLSRKGEEESIEILEKAAKERRAKCQEFLTLFMNDNPESAAVMFHGTFEFWTGPDSKILQMLVACENCQELPDYSSVLTEITINPTGSRLLHNAENRPGGREFILIAIGLEFLQHLGWSPTEPPATATEDSDEDEGEWAMNEAPQVIGLEVLTTDAWPRLQF